MISLKRMGRMFVFAAFVLAGAANVQAGSLPDFTDLIEEATDAVVNISTTQKVKSGHMDLPEGIEIPDLPEGTGWWGDTS